MTKLNETDEGDAACFKRNCVCDARFFGERMRAFLMLNVNGKWVFGIVVNGNAKLLISLYRIGFVSLYYMHNGIFNELVTSVPLLLRFS